MTDFVADTVDLLRRTPAVLTALLAGLPYTWTGTPDAADGWRPHDVLAHLISAELDDWIPRAERIIQDGATKPFDPFRSLRPRRGRRPRAARSIGRAIRRAPGGLAPSSR